MLMNHPASSIPPSNGVTRNPVRKKVEEVPDHKVEEVPVRQVEEVARPLETHAILPQVLHRHIVVLRTLRPTVPMPLPITGAKTNSGLNNRRLDTGVGKGRQSPGSRRGQQLMHLRTLQLALDRGGVAQAASPRPAILDNTSLPLMLPFGVMMTRRLRHGRRQEEDDSNAAEYLLLDDLV